VTDKPPLDLDPAALRQKVNLETGMLAWTELQRFFARGILIVVDRELDLVETAARFAEDDRTRVEAWLQTGKTRRATDDDARRWTAAPTTFWTVVVAPWVLVQESVP
jgi:hypothetical protein